MMAATYTGFIAFIFYRHWSDASSLSIADSDSDEFKCEWTQHFADGEQQVFNHADLYISLMKWMWIIHLTLTVGVIISMFHVVVGIPKVPTRCFTSGGFAHFTVLLLLSL